ncbi:MAG: HK97 family phage prohead protease [Fimbriimonadaceae bacterium]
MNNSGNSFSGIANVIGVIDRGGDVIAPGAFADALAPFLRTGFISLSHDWDALPVAMPDLAEERADGLWVTATFHSTRAAQAARSVVSERLDHGLSVGLSIGFRAEAADCVGFRSGAELLAYARRAGITGLDEPGIADWRTPCRLVLRVAELFEVSIVAVPMNPGSGVVAAQSPAAIRASMMINALRVGRASVPLACLGRAPDVPRPLSRRTSAAGARDAGPP